VRQEFAHPIHRVAVPRLDFERPTHSVVVPEFALPIHRVAVPRLGSERPTHQVVLAPSFECPMRLLLVAVHPIHQVVVMVVA
jgi:hypothetical protein